MKVLLVNGSPHEKGCTYTALREVADALNSEGIETEFYTIGTEATAPCRHCCACRKLGRCVIKDRVNDFVDYAAGFDGYVIGSPVHYGSMCGVAVPFLDRAFYVSFMSGRNIFRLKPAAAVVSARRAGTTATFDQLYKYFLISQMTVIGSRYWNMVHGMTPGTCERMKKVCRPCEYWAGIWPISSSVWRPPGRRVSSRRHGNPMF